MRRIISETVRNVVEYKGMWGAWPEVRDFVGQDPALVAGSVLDRAERAVSSLGVSLKNAFRDPQASFRATAIYGGMEGSHIGVLHKRQYLHAKCSSLENTRKAVAEDKINVAIWCWPSGCRSNYVLLQAYVRRNPGDRKRGSEQ